MKRILALMAFLYFITAFSQTTINNTFTGAPQIFLVPDCVYSLTITSAGAEGGGALGGNGAVITSTVSVNPGDILDVNVGGAGSCPNSGYNGGGSGFASTDGNATYNSCGGGGMSTVYINGTLYSIAAGGGGTGGGSNEVLGGNGGCNSGGNGGNTFGSGGTGGNQIAGGIGGTPWAGTPPGGQNGSANQGGTGGLWQTASGGGGGAGYFGGGGGGNDGCCTGANGGGGGGGGSSLVPLTGVCNNGVNTGNGYVTISYIEVVLYTTVNNQVCFSELYTFPDGTSQIITGPVTQVSTIQSVAGCDSIITTNLTVAPSYNILENFTLCQGDNFIFPDGTPLINAMVNTSHISNLFTIDGCDSIITTQLTVNPSYQMNESYTICQGEDFTFADGFTLNNINTSTTYTINSFNTINGCDSIIDVNINVIPPILSSYSVTLCTGEDYTFPDGTTHTNITSNESYTSNLTAVNGCDSNVTVDVFIFPTPNLTIDLSSVGGCTPFNLDFSTPVAALSYEWVITNGVNTYNFTGNNINNTFDEIGDYDVTLTITSADGCIVTQTFLDAFDVIPLPVSSFFVSPNQAVITDNEIGFFNNSYAYSSYIWYFGDGEGSTSISPTHHYQDTGKFYPSLIITNEYGCVDTSYGFVLIKDVFTIYVPNAFTPDADEYNAVFLPQVINVRDYHLTIYNRWGQIIFESYNSNVGWDGTYSDQGLVEDGIYIWVIDVVDINYKKQTLRGHVTVLK